jgi:hypothetical protein
MKYSKVLHDTLVKSNYYDSHIINALLDEIDRLHNQVTDYLAVNAELVEKYERLQSERRWIPFTEERPPADEKSYTAIMVNGKTYWTRLPAQPAPESEG